MNKAYKFNTDYEKMFKHIVGSAYTYVASSRRKSLVIGMSGGLDSTLTAAIAREVVDRLNTGVKLHGSVIDIESDSIEMSRASEAAHAFCDTSEYLTMTGVFWLTVGDIMGPKDKRENDHKGKVRRGNLKARMRMMKLYDLAQKHDGMVLSTDNYTEYLLGFWTLHGDVGDFGMIQNLWKTEVYGMAEYLMTKYNKEGKFYQADALKHAIDAVPTDGLGITDSDFDQLCPEASRKGSPCDIYNIVDTLLYDYLKHHQNGENDVVLRHEATHFKRINPFNIPRDWIVEKDYDHKLDFGQ